MWEAPTPTCPYACATGPDASSGVASRTGEVFGADSRCFLTRIPAAGGQGEAELKHGCFKVECDDVLLRQAGSYSVVLADGRRTSCGKSGAWVGWPEVVGEVRCDAGVCGSQGVQPSYEEARRPTVISYLQSAYAPSVAKVLVAEYDRGRFNPHPPKEKGVPEVFVMTPDAEGCDWGPWARGLESTTFASLGVTSFRGVSASILQQAVQAGCVAYVEQDLQVQAQDDASSVPWGLDSVDGVIDGVYQRFYSGKGVDVFILDTGIDASHPQLRGRVGTGQDFTNSGGTDDREGHGTHCAGTVAGTDVGVAPEATVVPVKVLGDDGSGQGSWILSGVNYVLEERRRRGSGGAPMVASASLGGSKSETLNAAWRSLVDAGVTVVVAAGNEDVDASSVSPASEPSVIAVGAVDKAGAPASFSNYGAMLDIWAPGVEIVSAKAGSTGLTTLSGTSMACPHVAGAAALLLQQSAQRTPEEILQELSADCMLDEGSLKHGSTGRLLRTWAGALPDGNLTSPCAVAAPDAGDGGLSVALVAGLVVAVVALLLLAVAAWCFWRRRAAKAPAAYSDSEPGDSEQGGSGSGSGSGSCSGSSGSEVAGPPRRSGRDTWSFFSALLPSFGGSDAGGKAAEAAPLQPLVGQDWEQTRAALPALAVDIQACDDLLRSKVLMENRLEEVWASLRINLRRCPKDGSGAPAAAPLTLGGVAGKAQVWRFLLQVAEARPFYREQAREVAAILERSRPWVDALAADRALAARRAAVLGQ